MIDTNMPQLPALNAVYYALNAEEPEVVCSKFVYKACSF